jgi:hypothetical protein
MGDTEKKIKIDPKAFINDFAVGAAPFSPNPWEIASLRSQ